MRLSVLTVGLSAIFLTASAASLPEVYKGALVERAGGDRLDINIRCEVCLLQCTAYLLLCAFSCGPGEIFGPVACGVCVAVLGYWTVKHSFRRQS